MTDDCKCKFQVIIEVDNLVVLRLACAATTQLDAMKDRAEAAAKNWREDRDKFILSIPKLDIIENYFTYQMRYDVRRRESSYSHYPCSAYYTGMSKIQRLLDLSIYATKPFQIDEETARLLPQIESGEFARQAMSSIEHTEKYWSMK